MSESKFTIPMAIVVAGALIGVAVYFSSASPLSLNGNSAGSGQGPSPTPTPVPYTISEKLIEYAGAAGLDSDQFKICYQERRSSEEIQEDLSDGQAAGVSGTPSFFINGESLVGAQPYTAIKQAIDKHLDDPDAEPAVDVSIEGEPYIGQNDAPVTVVEFTDFQCPFCKRAFDNNWEQLKEEYVDTGKVKYVVRDFPLSFHQNAESAAIAANCAFDQGGNDAYFTYHDILFENQSEWEVARVE